MTRVYRVTRIPTEGERVPYYRKLRRLYANRGGVTQFIKAHKSSTFTVEVMDGEWREVDYDHDTTPF